MKPFDIELARNGAPVCTRDGREARIICWDKCHKIFNIVALIKDCNVENVHEYQSDGKYNFDKKDSCLDLMMATTKHEGWINIYSDEEHQPTTSTNVYATKGDAEANKSIHDYITTIHIEWEE